MGDRQFLIYSLPRSGTAWLSIFLSHQNSFCYHDLLADTAPYMIPQKFSSRPESVVGTIETYGWGPGQDPYDFLGKVQCYVLIRDQNEIELSLRNLAMQGGQKDLFPLQASVSLFERFCRSRKCYYIFHANFHNINYLENLWKEVVGTPFDKDRALRLIEMNITRSLPAVEERARAAGRI